jgi:putative peptidoglycan lipid II flippase
VLLVALLIWQTSLVAGFVVQTSRAELYLQTVYLIRLLLPSTFFLCLSGLTMALLYAKGNFILPTFAGSIFNAAIVLTVLGLHERLGVASIVAGVTIGGLAQFVLQLPGITDIRYQFLFDLQHPAIRRILRLYAPLVLGIGFSLIGLLIDRWLASGFPSALATMQYAFTIFYSPLGLVATPIALAILPTLARETARGDDVAFRATLAMGLKIALLFILPITFGLAVLAQPITAIVLQYGVFVARDTHATAEAMLYYAPGLPAAVVAQVLLFSCFARAETLLPSLLQGLAILLYLLSAFLLLHLTNLGYLALVASTTIQMIGYMLMLAWLLKRQGTSLHEYAWVRQSLRGS